MRRLGLLSSCLLLAGCLTAWEDPVAHGAVGSEEFLAEAYAWLANSTTQDPRQGWHWGENGHADEAGRDIPEWDRPRAYVASTPFLMSLDSIQGSMDWKSVMEVLAQHEGWFHPDHSELSSLAIHGRYLPEDFEDLALDGVATHWQAAWQTEWKKGHQNPWGMERGRDGISWSRMSFSSGGTLAVCDDAAGGLRFLDSTQAFEKARTNERFRSLMSERPNAQVWLTLSVQADPQLRMAEDGRLRRACPESVSPTWRVRWMDLGGLLNGSGPYVDVVLNAVSGDIERVYGATMRPPRSYVWNDVFSAAERVVWTPSSVWSFEVPPDQLTLHISVRPDPPGGGIEIGKRDFYTATRPDGSSVDLDRRGAWEFYEAHPQSGTWRLERSLPAGLSVTHVDREIRVRVIG